MVTMIELLSPFAAALTVALGYIITQHKISYMISRARVARLVADMQEA